MTGSPLILPLNRGGAHFIAINRVRGATPGKRIMGIRLVGERNAAPIGFWRSVVRQLVRVVDGLLYIGYLMPL